jgi:outer membrane protein assembly factor BamD
MVNTAMTSRAALALRRSALILPLLALAGCGAFSSLFGSDDEAKAKAKLTPPVPVEQLYNEGVDQLNARRFGDAVKKFDSVEQNYPYSAWAINAQLMEGYSQYLQRHYTDAIGTLERFIQLHPTNKDIAYAYYLRALSHYEQIEDIQRDQKSTEHAMTALQEVVNRFPDSAYARDARLKIDLCRDHLAGKEMSIGRWYQGQHLYAAAINRFQRVVDLYQTTNHVPEALHRLTEIYLILGMPEEAKRTASVLGHNYPGSRWYEDSWNQLIADRQVKGRPAAGADNTPGLVARTLGWFF